MSTDARVQAFVRGALPPPPARVLEVGAGDGELARSLRGDGYDVVAIDPVADAPRVLQVALLDFTEPGGTFDAAVAVVSLHHLEPLDASIGRLAELLHPGAQLVVDEFDVDCFDRRAAAWWIEKSGKAAGPDEVITELRNLIHTVQAVRDALTPAFRLGAVARGPYLYRWAVPPGLLDAERELIAAGRLPATGARFVAERR
jgi:2-polyprenyl-3-methyl-5-hydroxy-6-metoxy-1,4-benzoquinol methylase